MDFKLSLLVSYRKRPQHLETFLSWFSQLKSPLVEAIVVEQSGQPNVQKKVLDCPQTQYLFMENSATFHLSKSLNLGLQASNSLFVAPFDVDLIPYQDTLLKQLEFAIASPALVFSGYRLMSPMETIFPHQMEEAVEGSAPSLSESREYLFQRMVEKQRYGVVPFMLRERLLELGGWNEAFIGWGAEDQEMIERYLAEDHRLLVRSESFIYVHQHHGFESDWKESNFVRKNRAIYFSQRGMP